MIVKESPLQGMTAGSSDSVAIRELPGLHMIDLRVAPGTASFNAVVKTLGVELPGKTGLSASMSIAGGAEAHVLCLAPDWWLIIGYEEAEQKLASLRSNNDNHFSVVDVSGQRTTIELEGPWVRELLEHLWEQDLREKSFAVGSVSQGLMAKAPVIVWRVAAFRFRVMVRSSFARHVWGAVVDAGKELKPYDNTYRNQRLDC